MGALSLLACHAFRQELGLWEASLRSGPLLSPRRPPTGEVGATSAPQLHPYCWESKAGQTGAGLGMV